jgi:ParB family chromosome partitioning protein
MNTRNLHDDARRGLGRGLSALIGDEPAASAKAEGGKGARSVPIAFLKPNRFQPRKNFAAEELQDLANSIREKGVLQPILVRPVAGEANAFEIVAGERRWRAAQLAKLHDVPIVIREIGDGEALELAIIENVQRADLNAVEEAAAYRELMGRFSYTQERVAQEVGKSRVHIANTLRLLTLPVSVQDFVRSGKLSAGHARTLVGSPDPEKAAHEILRAGLSVREAEQRSTGKMGKAKVPVHKDVDTRVLEANVSNRLGLKVQILHKGDKGGEVRINYKSLEQLDEIIRRLSNASQSF